MNDIERVRVGVVYSRVARCIEEVGYNIEYPVQSTSCGQSSKHLSD